VSYPSGKIQNFQDLLVWQRAHALALEVYTWTREFPRSELYGLGSQLRRAVVSTTANIVEGSKRRSTADLCHFLNIAEGSNEETKCLLMLAKDLGFLASEKVSISLQKADELSAMLHGLRTSLSSS
jgi:four helix bundle protein